MGGFAEVTRQKRGRQKISHGGIGVRYREDPRWAKKSNPLVCGEGWGGADFEKTLELYCMCVKFHENIPEGQ